MSSVVALLILVGLASTCGGARVPVDGPGYTPIEVAVTNASGAGGVGLPTAPGVYTHSLWLICRFFRCCSIGSGVDGAGGNADSGTGGAAVTRGGSGGGSGGGAAGDGCGGGNDGAGGGADAGTGKGSGGDSSGGAAGGGRGGGSGGADGGTGGGSGGGSSGFHGFQDFKIYS